MAARQRLALACGDYDRTRALRDGTVTPEGIDLIYLPMSPEEVFFRMARHREFDASELSLSSYVVSLDSETPPFVAIPVFPSRAFRHSGIFVSARSGIDDPSQLAGGRVGVAEYQLTANVWIRGILSDHYGLPVDAVTYVTGGLDEPGRIEKLRVELPEAIRTERAPADTTLSQLLADGELDAIYSPRMPSSFRTGQVTRMFEDWAQVEREYFETTGIFPIMHVIALRRELYEQMPWIAMSLLKAFEQALAAIKPALHEAAALQYSLPWLLAHVEEMETVLGPDPWGGGLERNRAVLDTFLRYSAEQGLARAVRQPEELFAPETLERFAV